MHRDAAPSDPEQEHEADAFAAEFSPPQTRSPTDSVPAF
ncbi:hypothetical protein AB0M12_41950 [Nocardia vinacea]